MKIRKVVANSRRKVVEVGTTLVTLLQALDCDVRLSVRARPA